MSRTASQGNTVNTKLTKLGHKQAKTIAKILKARVDDPAALLYVASPLKRACETMEIIRERLDLPLKSYKTDKRIQEIDLGEWDGLTHDEARALDPKPVRQARQGQMERARARRQIPMRTSRTAPNAG